MMNLYCVYPAKTYSDYDWCCYVFAATRNKARAMLVGYFDNNNEYTDFNAVCVKKDTGGRPEICDQTCPRLEALGVRYREEGEDE